MTVCQTDKNFWRGSSTIVVTNKRSLCVVKRRYLTQVNFNCTQLLQQDVQRKRSYYCILLYYCIINIFGPNCKCNKKKYSAQVSQLHIILPKKENGHKGTEKAIILYIYN